MNTFKPSDIDFTLPYPSATMHSGAWPPLAAMFGECEAECLIGCIIRVCQLNEDTFERPDVTRDDVLNIPHNYRFDECVVEFARETSPAMWSVYCRDLESRGWLHVSSVTTLEVRVIRRKGSCSKTSSMSGQRSRASTSNETCARAV